MMNGKHDTEDTVAAQRRAVAEKTGAFNVDQLKDGQVHQIIVLVDEDEDTSTFVDGEKVHSTIDPYSLKNVQGLITQVCDGTKAVLLEKNVKYGNAAIQPKRIFSKASPMEQIAVRIDDKLSRIATMGGLDAADEDTVQDLHGYLTLYMVARRLERK